MGPTASSRSIGGRWTFHPRVAIDGAREEDARRTSGLEAALRAGHGAAIAFSLVLRGGLGGPIELTADRPAGQRWVERSLTAAYAPGEWRRASPAPADPTRETWTARRRTLPGEVLSAPLTTGVVFRALESAVRLSSPAGRCVLAVRPRGESRWGKLSDWLEIRTPAPPTPNPSRLRPLDRPRSSPPVPRARLSWEAQVSWEAPESQAGVVSALASASASIDGVGFEFSRLRTPRARPSSVPLTQEELLALLPGAIGPASPPEPFPTRSPGLPVGRSSTGGLVELPIEPEQGRHVALLGETGMGKSSLLTSIGVRASFLGGLVLLDPLGETAAALRAELDARRRPYRWIAPGAPQVGIDALAGVRAALDRDPVRAGRELEALVHALRRVRAGRFTDSAYWGPRLEEMLGRALRAAAHLPGGTLEEAHALLSRREPGRLVGPSAARAEWHELASRIQERPEDAEGARRLLFEIVRNPTLAAMLCARQPSFSVASLVEPTEVTIVSGEAGVVGEPTARYLLSVYLALLWAELLARTDRGKSFVLLDEAQWCGHEALAEMLRLARRRNVHVIAATQSLASLPAEVAEAVRTNVADWVVFRGGAEEVRGPGRGVVGVRAETVLSLPRGEAVVLVGKGEAVHWARTARWPIDGRAAPEGELGSSSRAVPARLPPGAAGLDRVICEQARRAEPGAWLEFSLADWRRSSPADVRRLGGRLGRAGAIVRVDRTKHGTVWRLDPARTLQALGGERAIRDRPAGETGGLDAGRPHAPSATPVETKLL